MPLERTFGTLTQIGGGYHSVVYADEHDQIIKVYKHNNGLNKLEASNMIRAGLGDWVVGTPTIAGQEALVMRRFEGAPIHATTIAPALPALGEFLRQLHAPKYTRVVQTPLKQKLERFREQLEPYPELEPMFMLVHQALDSGLLEVPSAFCHLDLWFENILFAPPHQVRVVDWHKAALDDPARDYALLFTGTLELLPIEEATTAIKELTAREDTVLERLPAYVALTTLHDLYWFSQKQPAGFAAAFELKVPRIQWFLEH
ncbi:MAG: phosphotransferase family protein [Deinococcales bacterium]